ncbi:ABC transporter permease subunit [Psychromonas sp. 14N.309.X.WAT.B.A12]|uniref:ABC transporter permease n=1 Tax=Psychromonas sp. 14N.309.X.WAT.B.A12 TaxID=2998322 RepID=UPI0025B1EC98|nr:ABC transporter permease subunit [Psychromonas sp. 14N.309.X.WAT.B.A12]MDN2664580.1 ABC transporter permease subunit [Psychromonas sp. 14N.309.X.WAT.B.A12]
MNTQQTASLNQVDYTQPIKHFTQRQSSYYQGHFTKIQTDTRLHISFNFFAALFGPLWAASRSVWGFFWVSAIAILISSILLGQGLWGEAGGGKLAQADRLFAKSQEMATKGQAALNNGEANANAFFRNSDNLRRAAEKAVLAAEENAKGASQNAIYGGLLLFVVFLIQGFTANAVYEKQYCRWRQDSAVGSGFHSKALLCGIAILAFIYPLTLYRFISAEQISWLVEFPSDKAIFNTTANWLNSMFDFLALNGANFFDAITQLINLFLDVIETVLVGTPWPVIMMLIVFMSWRISGIKAAFYTAIALSYLAFFGYWEKSMATISLLGAAAVICVVVGVPLGVLCAKNKTIDSITKPALDFMQTMPAFVYLIPIIAFFGTGKPPGVLATIIFGMPPVVRLTTLGIQQVPASIVEGALAFGCSRKKLLLDVELPLAKSSILAGINQTILMCLSMVVIASLIGAEGLGTDVLQALQFAAKGQGLLAGLAILFCAIMIDRIIQGLFKPKEKTE